MNSTNELSNLSYTNKDFNSIYSELLEYAKAISYKWDPTASDESDPGIVLLKLAALIGDKDNYNIDKNVLELMPVSVTQPAAARQLFEQCGYSMKHYHAAEGSVNLTINKIPEELEIEEEAAKGITYTIPMFTNFSDTDRIVTYTTTSESSLSFKETQPVNVIEGTPIRYTINNDDKITIANLDNKNRLYFTEKNVAENGIFINNVSEQNFESWVKVDNLSTQPSGYPCYKFGLSVDTDTCYIEFPEDAMLLFKEGINITYITTSGKSGNIAARKLKILSDEKTAIKISARTQETRSTLEAEFVDAIGCLHIVNPLPILTGEDPESIDDAYRNYKRVKDTFDTLVSLKDYTDYMITSKAASNGYVCDRLNDVQHSYKVLSVQDFGNELKTYVENSALTAFDLTCYALQYRSTVNTEKLFKETFALIIPDKKGRPFSDEDFELVKSLQHNFKQFETNKILLIKNKYPIKTTIIPRYKVSLIEKYQIQDNVRIALYEALNSKKLYFGDPISYDLIYDTIMNADERIKAITLNFPTYETYAVYYDGKEINELRIDSTSTEPETEAQQQLWNSFRAEVFAKNVLKGVTPLYDSDNEFTYGVTQNFKQIFQNVKKIETNTDIELSKDDNNYVSDTLQENENLLLTAPSYIEENNFSSYVKIIYQFNGEGKIATNSKYELQANEYIVFLWKASDVDENYSYIKYDGTDKSLASMISPSFTLNKIQWSGVTIDSPQDKLQKYFSNTNLPHKGTVNDTTINDYIKSMSSSKTEGNLEVLTGDKVIKTYGINQVVVKQPCCWITNTVSVDETTKKKKSVLFADNVTEITLSSGEYFFYTNAERTLLNILGEGTKLTRETSEKLFPTCNILDYDELMSEGIDYLSNEWVQEVEVTAAEMESLLLGPGSQLVLTYPEGSSIPTKISSNEVISLSSCSSIEYKVDGTNAFVVIPQISGDNGWKIKSILNIDCSKTKPQEIKSHQTITIYNEILSEEGTKVSACYIQSSKPVNKVGNLIDVSDVKDLEIMKFNAVDSTKTQLSYNVSDSLASISVNSIDKAEIELENFKVPDGTYLIQITSDALMETLSLDKGTKLSGPDSKPSHQCTYKLSSTNALKITAKISVKASKKSATLTIHPLFKYTNTTLDSFGVGFEKAVIDRIAELDVENNFDYITDIESPINNPLVSETFCNIKHFYNPYTICEWQEEDIKDGTDIDVTTAIK